MAKGDKAIKKQPVKNGYRQPVCVRLSDGRVRVRPPLMRMVPMDIKAARIARNTATGVWVTLLVLHLRSGTLILHSMKVSTDVWQDQVLHHWRTASGPAGHLPSRNTVGPQDCSDRSRR
jgi:hypothetical protein